jgi:CheY-like chemotaxis protein
MRGRIKILIVDDDADDRDLFCDALIKIDKNIACLQAINGQDAMEQLLQEKIKPDYIFLDLNMPKMGGKHLLRTIKLHSQFSKIPVIIYSTSKLQSDIDEAVKDGAAFFITKPTKLADLITSIKRVIEE